MQDSDEESDLTKLWLHSVLMDGLFVLKHEVPLSSKNENIKLFALQLVYLSL